MEYCVRHKDFIKNKIFLEISPMKIQVKYNNEIVKGKRGKYILEDDNNKKREIKIVDYLITSPFITIDKNEKVSVFPNISKYVIAFLIPAILMIRFGVIGWALSAISIYSIRNISLDKEKVLSKKLIISFLVIIISYIILFSLIMIININPFKINL